MRYDTKKHRKKYGAFYRSPLKARDFPLYLRYN